MYSCTVSPWLAFAVSAQALGLARDLTDVVSQSIFDVSRLVEAARHQRFDPLLGGGAADRTTARIPPAGERELAAVARRPATDEGDGGEWRAGQTHEEVRPRWQSCGAGRH